MFIAGKVVEVGLARTLLHRSIQGIKLEKFKYELPETLIGEQDFYKYIRDKTKVLNYMPDYTLKRIYKHLTNEAVHWESIPWVEKQWLHEGTLEKEFYIYSTDVEDYKLYLRLNDFPEEPLYTIVYDDIELFHMNTFGRRWTSDHSSSRKRQGNAKSSEEEE